MQAAKLEQAKVVDSLKAEQAKATNEVRDSHGASVEIRGFFVAILAKSQGEVVTWVAPPRGVVRVLVPCARYPHAIRDVGDRQRSDCVVARAASGQGGLTVPASSVLNQLRSCRSAYRTT